MTKIHTEKVRNGTIAWINLSSNPQKYNNSVRGEVNSIVSLDTFDSNDYGIDKILKVSFKSNQTKKRIGYLESVIYY